MNYWSRLTDDQKREIIRCLREDIGLGVSDIARLAGVNPSTVAAWLSGRAYPQLDKLEKMYNTNPELVERCLPEPPITRLDVDHALSVIAKAARHKAFRDYVIAELSKIFPGGIKREIVYRVEKEDLVEFRNKLNAEGVSRDTRDRYIRYLVRFLDAVGWAISTDAISKLYSLEMTPKVRRETAVALKRFIDTVVKAKEPEIAALLYNSFTVPKVKKRNNFRVPTIEEVKKVWEEAHKISPCAATVWGIMAETGIRFDHLHRAPLSGLQLDKRRLLLGETEGPKRQPLIFLTEGAAKYLRDVYLPWRERFLRMLGQRDDRLFPCEELTIYRWLKEARERAGLPWLEPRLLRKFNAQWFLDSGVDLSDIAILQGRALPSSLAITVEHYIQDYERRLRSVFDKYAPRVFPEKI